MIKANTRSKRGVYKFQAGGIIYYRLGNGISDARDKLFRDLERKMGSSVLVPEIIILSQEKQ